MTCRFVFVFFILAILMIGQCVSSIHLPPLPDQIQYTFSSERTNLRVKRRVTSDEFRIFVHYDISVKKLDKNEQILIQRAVEMATDFWSKAIRPKYNLNDRIRLTRQCSSRKIFIVENDYSVHYCFEQCLNETLCGDVYVPDDHLQRCHVCNKKNKCDRIGKQGYGVNAEFILYVSAKDTDRCQPTDTLATASFCQLESDRDRPIAGNVNVCPRRLKGDQHAIDFDRFVSTIKHEILHTLVFSSGLFAFFRDKNGKPLTERDSTSRWPKSYDENLQIYIPSENVLKKLVRKNWLIRRGTMNKQVSMLVTPRVQEVVREHFDCARLEGAELEDQGNAGTALTHWEKRLFEHEIMTGTYTQESIISNLTLALLEDSGWYDVSYEYGKPLLWGRSLGCDFVENSCKQWIDAKLANQQHPHPFCISSPKSQSKRICADTHDKVVMCNLIEYSQALPIEYQIFDSLGNITDDDELARFGGHVMLANYCPYNQELAFKNSHRDSRCYRKENQPPSIENYALEMYSSVSKCFDHGSIWEQYIDQCRRKRSIFPQVAGCYQFECLSSHGISVQIGNKKYLCEYHNQNITFIIIEHGLIYVGSIICPDCQIVCGSIKDFVCPTKTSHTSIPSNTPSNTRETIENLCNNLDRMSLSDKKSISVQFIVSVCSFLLFCLPFYGL